MKRAARTGLVEAEAEAVRTHIHRSSRAGRARAGPRRGGAVAAAFLACLAAGCRPGGALPSEADPPPQRPCPAAQPYCNNQWTAVSSTGRKLLMARWAIGSLDHIVTLRIPLEFVPPFGRMGCAAFGPNYPDPDCQGPVSRSLLLDFMWPDFSPVPTGRRLTEDEERREINILVQSNIGYQPGRNEVDYLRRVAKVSYESITRHPPGGSYPTVEKEGRSGLHRIGPDHPLRGDHAISLKDYLFTGSDPLASDDVLTCTVEEARPRDEDPSSQVNPSCQHWFASTEISALVKVTYGRGLQAHWREIRERIDAFLASFKPGE